MGFGAGFPPTLLWVHECQWGHGGAVGTAGKGVRRDSPGCAPAHRSSLVYRYCFSAGAAGSAVTLMYFKVNCKREDLFIWDEQAYKARCARRHSPVGSSLHFRSCDFGNLSHVSSLLALLIAGTRCLRGEKERKLHHQLPAPPGLCQTARGSRSQVPKLGCSELCAPRWEGGGAAAAPFL